MKLVLAYYKKGGNRFVVKIVLKTKKAAYGLMYERGLGAAIIAGNGRYVLFPEGLFGYPMIQKQNRIYNVYD